MKVYDKKCFVVGVVFSSIFLLLFGFYFGVGYPPENFQPEVVLCKDSSGMEQLGTKCLSLYEPPLEFWVLPVLMVIFGCIGSYLLGKATTE